MPLLSIPIDARSHDNKIRVMDTIIVDPEACIKYQLNNDCHDHNRMEELAADLLYQADQLKSINWNRISAILNYCITLSEGIIGDQARGKMFPILMPNYLHTTIVQEVARQIARPILDYFDGVTCCNPKNKKIKLDLRFQSTVYKDEMLLDSNIDVVGVAQSIVKDMELPGEIGVGIVTNTLLQMASEDIPYVATNNVVKKEGDSNDASSSVKNGDQQQNEQFKQVKPNVDNEVQVVEVKGNSENGFKSAPNEAHTLPMKKAVDAREGIASEYKVLTEVLKSEISQQQKRKSSSQAVKN